MKKIFGKWWIKCIAAAICIISILTGAVSLIAMICEAKLPQGELLDQVYQKIADNYSAFVLENYQSTTDQEAFLEKIRNDIDPQFQFAILKSDEKYWYENTDTVANVLGAYDGAAEYLYGDAEDVRQADYWFRGGDECGYVYATNSLLDMMESGYYYMETSSADYDEEVFRVIYDAQTGLFYYETESGYYPVHSVVSWSSLLEKMQSEEWEQERTYQLTQEDATWLYISIEAEEMNTDSSVTVDSADTTTDSSPAKDPAWIYLSEEGYELGRLYPGDEVQLENKTCAIRTLTEDNGLVNGNPGLYVLYVESMDSLTSEENVHGYEDTYVKNGMLAHSVEQSPGSYYYVFSYVDETVQAGSTHQFFAEAAVWVERWEGIARYAIPLEVLSVMLCLAAFLFLMCAAGHRSGDADIHLNALDTIWLEVILLVAGLAELGIGVLMLYSVEMGIFTIAGLLTMEIELAVAGSLILLIFFMTIAVRIKAGKFWRYTCLYWCWRGIRKVWKMVCYIPVRFFRWAVERRNARREFARTHGSMIRRTLLVLIAATAVAGFSFVRMCVSEYYYALWFVGVAIVMWVLTLSAAIQMTRLQEGSRRLAEGDLSEPIDTKGLFWEFKIHAENINKAGIGIASAVEKQMKSERFKTELITNVSHDIKTPLTSIINYVDLIQKEQPENEKIKEYIDVLARQSSRLKKLIEDLMEASKASTGNLAVNFETCDARVLLTQIVGEFEEKTAANSLEMIVENPDEEVDIRVDSRHIWRVLDNLLGNICKYAQPGTRVYINLVHIGDEAVITFKNISRYRLNITSEELMERFVRGDSSRNTEGSGLGLSIAQSLTTLMNGKLELSVDGDLFKVTLRFPVRQQ
jgi:signal transduction histidine kinase